MFKILDDVCKPTKATRFSAGIDLYARKDVVIGAGETVKVPLGVKVDLESFFFGEAVKKHITPDDKFYGKGADVFIRSHHLELFNRSSTALKRGLMLANGTGIIDLDYPDEICALLHKPFTPEDWMIVDNDVMMYYPESVEVKKGDKICQIILKENKTYLMGVESDEERTGGFGSSGS